ncbi:TPA: hypothetical protein ACH5MI_002228 [Klebsiella quasipneumoniae]|uniref:hypothetical protein n=1 Tax=Klebsiella quasipneumoniae TaxID=1463165 RepID=UPI0008E2ED75|nr:hypothetical protein [Klebsiella quasipneumoniae]MCS5747596.1 hypothetical protein [Klebsiella quasipneumoniae subsp. quasipneumoniae]SFG70138.1 hypothetical protein SAMN03159418_01811 [Klebsiella quasipneumoniae]SFX50990.1 hypothetical protein SAMN03159364_01946 [Klebsiella quasipneumoniae]SFX99522.1 hypothetical protein SAMN03159289_02826 [Klebsiella quasipneumoniae]SMC48146.1 hypothetical protein SAMN03159480_101425 [Klebsiella quasipneumoniae]
MNISRRFLLGGALGSLACFVYSNQSKLMTFANNNQSVDAMSNEIGDAYKESINGENVSLLSFLNKEKIKALNILGNEVDITNEFRNALKKNTMKIYFPPQKGIYVLNGEDIVLPAGFSIFGDSKKIYNVKSSESFNNSGTVIRIAKNSKRLFNMTGNHIFFGVNFDGLNRHNYFMQSAEKRIKNCKFINCGFYRWKAGVGNSSYCATLSLFNCIITSNYIGVMNVIDSSIINSIINANLADGVRLMKGANNNSFLGVRNEWNGATNYFSSGATQNIVTGELVDRAGKNGFVALNGGSWLINSVIVKRSGRNADDGSNDSAHFYVDGENSSIILSGVKTLAGKDDGNTGHLSPQHSLIIGSKGAAKIIIGSSDLTGSVGEPIIGIEKAKEKSISGLIQ